VSLSIYQIKPKFQALLRPLVNRLAKLGITANQVTVLTCVISLLLGLGVFFAGADQKLFLLIPAWMFLRMAFNAVDGMLAREHQMQSKLGAFLNELTDVISDAALLAPFALLAMISPFLVVLIIVLAGLSEFAGALGQTVGASRRYDGPMGKSDRAFVFGALALYIGLGGTLNQWINIALGVVAALIVWNCINRVRNAITESTPVIEQEKEK
jgi:CDP-diacylglycerol---glycerol-3-phosphate 3-phosphatidyltransferase